MTMWTRARNADTGGEAVVPVDSLVNIGAKGWEAYGDPTEDRSSLVTQIDQEKAEAALVARQEAAQAAQTAAEGTRDAVLAEVGDDPARARAALEAEQAKDKPRSTLVAALEPIANSDAGQASNAGGE